jgi:hypothetical protein
MHFINYPQCSSEYPSLEPEILRHLLANGEALLASDIGSDEHQPMPEARRQDSQSRDKVKVMNTI